MQQALNSPERHAERFVSVDANECASWLDADDSGTPILRGDARDVVLAGLLSQRDADLIEVADIGFGLPIEVNRAAARRSWWNTNQKD
jgi:hypothetical protein